jgi:RimJ/RimL family protein N-acetyltransferase
MTIRFYVWQPGVDSLPEMPSTEGLAVDIWRPTLVSFRPRGAPLFPYAVWWTFHYTHVFANRECGVVLLRSGDNVVHKSLVTPRYFRFADMSDDDLQIGAVYTRVDWRGKGIARAAVRIACEAWMNRCAKLWYIASEENRASIKLIEACGFRLAGTGARIDRYGLRTLARYKILKHAH